MRSVLLAMPALGGCLSGEIADRPRVEGQVVGGASRVGLCTASLDTCVDEAPVTLSAEGSFTLQPSLRTVKLLIPADPAVGYSVLWACGPEGLAAGAIIGGSVTTEASVQLTLTPSAELPIETLSLDATRLPTLEEARARVQARCQEAP